MPQLAKLCSGKSLRQQRLQQVDENDVATTIRRTSDETQPETIVHSYSPPASRQCPFCAELILAEAKKCKHCGEFLTESPSRASDKIKTPWYKPTRSGKWGIALLSLMVVLAALGDNKRRPSSRLDTAHELQMIKAAQRGVSSILKAPSTAEFPSPTFNRGAYSISEVSPGTYRVTGYVDAQNSFGAKLRNNWAAICQGNGMDWIASDAILLDP